MGLFYRLFRPFRLGRTNPYILSKLQQKVQTSQSAYSHSSSSSSHSSSSYSSRFARHFVLPGRTFVLAAGLVGVAVAASASEQAMAARLHVNPHDPSSRILDARTIAQMITKNEQTKIINNNNISQVHVNSFNANPICEDSYAVRTSLLSAQNGPNSKEDGALFGVFDGHSGTAASFFLRDHLFNFLETYFLEGRTKKILESRPFVEADQLFLEECFEDKRPQDGLSGACYAVAHVKPNSIRTAWGGDCRVILGRRADFSSLTKNDETTQDQQQSIRPHYLAIPLTEDHQIETNHKERERLLSQHQKEFDILLHNRVKGRLQPTRGFGDGAYKMNKYFQVLDGRIRERYMLSGWNAPYTTAEPETVEIPLVPSRDDFLIIASDGLFQDCTNEEVVSFMEEFLEQTKKKRN